MVVPTRWNAKTRKRMERAMAAISKSPGCDQTFLSSQVKCCYSTTRRDVVALERRALVTVKRGRRHEHYLSEAGDRYVKNM